MISKSIAQAQVRVEGYNFDIRKKVLEYDDVVNKQREVIYAMRRDVVFKDSLRDDYLKILEDAVVGVLDEYAPENTSPELWDLEGMYRALLAVFPVPEEITPETLSGLNLEELETTLIDAVRQAYDRKEAELGADMMRRLEKWMMLRMIDQHWQRHLTDLDILREGIGLMSVAQRDPLVEYKRQAFGMWQGMMDEVRALAAYQLLTTQVQRQPPQPVRRIQYQAQPQTQTARAGGAAESKPEPVRVQHKLGRNDPCWCGSGKKYKNCHWKQERGGQVVS
jgi:preprotein translocase subunit SecA